MILDVVHCADALSDLPALVDEESVDLAYIDPPFFTQKQQRGRNRQTGDVSVFEDRWDHIDTYRKWAQQLFAAVARTLCKSGGLLVHCDWRTVHHLRVALDEVVGSENFRNEIVWHYRKWTNSRSSLQRTHQTILYYAKSDAHCPDVPLVDYSPTTNLDQIWQARTRNDDNVAVYLTADGGPISSGAKQGVPMGDVWDIPYLNPKARERVGYPTQKPLMLLERLVALASPPEGVVLDPCCGSGSTLVAAKLLGRHWIGLDTSPEAVALSEARIGNPVRSESTVERAGRDSFFRVHDDDVLERTLRLLGAHVVHRNKLIDGYVSPTGLRRLGLSDTLTVMVRVIRPKEALHELAEQLSRLAYKKRCDLALLVARDASPAGVRVTRAVPRPTLWGESDASDAAETEGVLIVPAPSSKDDIDAIRRLLRTHAASLTIQDEERQTP